MRQSLYRPVLRTVYRSRLGLQTTLASPAWRRSTYLALADVAKLDRTCIRSIGGRVVDGETTTTTNAASKSTPAIINRGRQHLVRSERLRPGHRTLEPPEAPPFRRPSRGPVRTFGVRPKELLRSRRNHFISLARLRAKRALSTVLTVHDLVLLLRHYI
jgi:hypothetical protein